MKYVCKKELCTGCGACKNICPKGSITFYDDLISGNKAIINQNTCINCGKCKQVCPSKSHFSVNKPMRCFAGWSSNAETRLSSASGGIATELYRYYANKHEWFIGCLLNSQHKAVLCAENKDYTLFQNSKYVYSDMSDVYKKIESLLQNNSEVLFIGLPCQIAGLKKYLTCKYLCQDNLTCIDLICHGVIKSQWFIDYISKKEFCTGKSVKKISFRDPKYGTNNFILSLLAENEVISSAPVNRSDEYQLAYHKGIAYRDNCYHCQFAQEYRIGDLTLADFTGIGSHTQFIHSKDNISCILVNTERGLFLLKSLVNASYIQIDERPLEEEFEMEQRLHTPTPFPKERYNFIRDIQKGLSFTDAIRDSMRFRIIKNELKYRIKKILKWVF